MKFFLTMLSWFGTIGLSLDWLQTTVIRTVYKPVGKKTSSFCSFLKSYVTNVLKMWMNMFDAENINFHKFIQF